MTFLLPIGLLSLLSLPVILVLHLVRQRRRRVRVPSLELWQAGAMLVQRKPRRIPLTLLLLLHLLVAALLALSLGRPLLPGASFAPTNTIVVLDTSSSMATEDAGASGSASRWEEARDTATQLFNRARTGDQLALVTLGQAPRMVGRGGPEAAESLARAVETLKPGGADGDLQAALALANAAAQPDNERRLPTRFVVLTDPSFGSQTAETVPLTITGELDWRVFGAPSENVALVAFAAEPVRRGGQQLYARVANLGAQPAARSLQVVLDGKVVQAERVRLEPGTEAEWSWPLPADTQVAEARLSPGDAARLDDSASAVLTGRATYRVLLVSAVPTPLERALRAQPDLEVNIATPSNYQGSADTDLFVFVDFLPESLPPAPTLIVAPPQNNSLINTAGTDRDLRADVAPDRRFASIDLRAIRITRAATVEPPAWAGVLLAAGDTPLVLNGVYENHPRTIWTFDPANSNLAGRLAFPLITAASLQTLLPQSTGALHVGMPAPDTVVSSQGESIPAGATLAEPGLYTWAGRDAKVAVNAIDVDESMLLARARPPIDVVELPANPSISSGGQELWRFLVIGALVLLLIEWLYVHRHDLRRQRRVPSAGRPA